MALAGNGDVVLAGETNTTAGLPLVNAYQTKFQGGMRDGFVARINGALTTVVFSTYFGGNDRDVAKDVALTPRARFTSSAPRARRCSRWCAGAEHARERQRRLHGEVRPRQARCSSRRISAASR